MPSHLMHVQPYISAPLRQMGREDVIAEFEDGIGSGDQTGEGNEQGEVIDPVGDCHDCSYVIQDGSRTYRMPFTLFCPTQFPDFTHLARFKSVCQEVTSFPPSCDSTLPFQPEYISNVMGGQVHPVQFPLQKTSS